jgi:hypothetical protein
VPKSHVASELFDETHIFGRGYRFEDLARDSVKIGFV